MHPSLSRVASTPVGSSLRTGLRASLRLAWRVSRVRFWLYLGGTYLVGYALGAASLGQFADPPFLLHLLYFLVPANVLLYGVNDLFDRDTDATNPKKGVREHRLRAEEVPRLRALLLLAGGAGGLLVLLHTDLLETLLMAGFLLLATLYSAPPVRLKAVPLLDSSSNVLYGLPGILAYVQAAGSLPPFPALGALFLWTFAMHLFSAVPDIDADRRAGVRTTAVVLGPRASLALCASLWLASALLVTQAMGAFLPWSYGTFLYGALPLLALHPRVDVNRVYWAFPALNGAAGFAAFLLAAGPLLLPLVP